MKSYYDTNDFDYDKYKEAQIKKNIEKQKTVWVYDKELDLICNHIKRVKSGICHGARNCYEVNYFREKLGGKWIGTDISETILQYGGIVHDFNKPLNMKVDMVYTNSLDHAYSFKNAFSNMYEQAIKYLVLHIDLDHEKRDEADCLMFDRKSILKSFNKRNLKYTELKIWNHRPIFVIKVGGN